LQFQGSLERPLGVVFVGYRRAVGGIQVAALVANGELQEHPAKACYDCLGLADEDVQLFSSGAVAIVINAFEVQEEHDRRAQLGQEVTLPGLQALPHGRKDPGPDQVGV
jgi:hypothetical protein